jgi:predicted ATPase
MSHAQILELAPFTDDEVTESIGRLLPHIDPFVVSEICRYSGGNPLYIEELCHSAAHERSNHRLGRVVGARLG